MKNKETYRLYAITDENCLADITLYDAVVKALKGGITCLQYREKSIGSDINGISKEKIDNIAEIMELCRTYNVPFIINDNIPLAKFLDADGVHIGQDDMRISDAREILGNDKIIGVTAKTVSQAKEAYEGGADYLGSGAIFGTSTKFDAKKMDMETLKSICESVPIPVVAIGGITKNNAHELIGTGIAGFAVVNGIFGEKDIENTCKFLKNLSEEL